MWNEKYEKVLKKCGKVLKKCEKVWEVWRFPVGVLWVGAALVNLSIPFLHCNLQWRWYGDRLRISKGPKCEMDPFLEGRSVKKVWRKCEKSEEKCGKSVEKVWISVEKSVEKMWKSVEKCGESVEQVWKKVWKSVEKVWKMLKNREKSVAIPRRSSVGWRCLGQPLHTISTLQLAMSVVWG